MKKLLVLGAGLLQIPVIKKAKEMGVFVIGADDNSDAPGLVLCDKACITHITDAKLMVKLAKDEKIDGVIHPCSEVAMSSMGAINSEMNLCGVDKDVAIRATNKEVMRKAFMTGGAPSPISFGVVSFYDAIFAAKKIKGDMIVKPSRSSGSRGVTFVPKVFDESLFKSAFERALKESRDNSVVIEQYVNGPEFSVEIIIWDKKVNILAVTDKITTGPPYFVELGHSQPSLYSSDDLDLIIEAARKGVIALGLNNCAAHAEVKLSDRGAFIMEIGARLGGDFISTELVHISTGIDMVLASVQVALGIKPDLLPKTMPMGVAIRYLVPKPGILCSIKGSSYAKRKYVYQLEIYPKIGDVIPSVKSSLDRSGHVIVTANSASLAIKRADRIIKDIKLITK
jgi:biotin carboxylase